MDELAADVELVVVEGRDFEREGPLEAVFDFSSGCAGCAFGPDFDVARTVGTIVEADHNAAHGTCATGGRPDEIGIDRIGSGEAGFTAADRVPGGTRNARAGEAGSFETVAWTGVRWAVLLIAINIVGDLVIRGGVIHLGDGQVLLNPRLAAVERNGNAEIAGDDHALAVRVNPDVVVILADALGIAEAVSAATAGCA